MIKWVLIIISCCSYSFLFSQNGWSDAFEDKVEKSINAFIDKDPSIERFFDDAYAYVIFPAIGKGGIGIGGATGKGLVIFDHEAIGEARLIQVSIGFQWGGQSYSEIIFFEDVNSFHNFTNGELKLTAQASAVAVDQGVAAKANFEDGMAIFTMAKGGLMYEASVGGQKFDYYPDENER